MYGGLKEKIPPVVFFPYDQGYPPPAEMVFELRTAGDPLGYVSAVRDIVRRADARVPVADIRTQAAEIDQSINEEITLARLCTIFALLALTIACVGLYGTVACNVARRTGEIGIRMALGAQRGRLVWMVLREVLALAAVGIAISVPAALGASKLVASFLFGMKPNDPWALTVAVGTLLARGVGGGVCAGAEGGAGGSDGGATERVKEGRGEWGPLVAPQRRHRIAAYGTAGGRERGCYSRCHHYQHRCSVGAGIVGMNGFNLVGEDRRDGTSAIPTATPINARRADCLTTIRTTSPARAAV